MATLVEPIMVSFGTNQGPIVPRPTTTPPPAGRRIDYNVKPAPVYENVEDTPNPSTYRPLIPHQYRSKFFSFKPKANLILGTPLDIKFTPSLGKYEQYKRKQAKAFGYDYKGPQFFEKQAYEYELEKQRYKPKPFAPAGQSYLQAEPRSDQYDPSYQQAQPNQPGYQQNQPGYYQGYQQNQQYQPSQVYPAKVVPEIGIIYSGGVRYYVPQLVYYGGNHENSVYDQNDIKYNNNKY